MGIKFESAKPSQYKFWHALAVYLFPGIAPPVHPASFNDLASEMYKRFGGCARNLSVLAKSDTDRELLVAQLHELRAWVREAFNAIKEVKP